MELIGKAKKDFEKWRKHQNFHVDAPYFYELKYSMQYGVYVDWFDSVGIEICINYYHNDNSKWQIDIDEYFSEHIFKTRQEARTEAIKKANEIYNDK